MMPKYSLLLLPVLLALGCLRSPAPVVLHSLRGSAPAGTLARDLAVEVLPVSLPEVLQRPQLVTALGPNTVELAPGHRWANGLDQELQRVLVDELSALLGSGKVVAYPYGPRVNAAYRVEVAVQRCEGRPGGTLTFQATWMLTRGKAVEALVLRKTALTMPVPGADVASLVTAHEQAVTALAREIAQALADAGA
jgi:uncharacterized lipoprotein YmbA